MWLCGTGTVDSSEAILSHTSSTSRIFSAVLNFRNILYTHSLSPLKNELFIIKYSIFLNETLENMISSRRFFKNRVCFKVKRSKRAYFSPLYGKNTFLYKIKQDRNYTSPGGE